MSALVGVISLLPAIYVPYLLHQQMGLSTKGIATVLTASALVGATSAFNFGRARTWLSAHSAMLVAFGLAGCGHLLTGEAGSLPLPVVGVLVFSAGAAWFVPVIMAFLGSKVANEYHWRATGLVKVAHFLSGPICVALLDSSARRFGTSFILECRQGWHLPSSRRSSCACM